MPPARGGDGAQAPPPPRAISRAEEVDAVLELRASRARVVEAHAELCRLLAG